jgi:hypothetical protein
MDNYFRGFTVEYIKHNKNVEAGELAKATTRNTLMSADVFFRCLRMPRSKQSYQSLW